MPSLDPAKLTTLERKRIATMREAEYLSGMSADTLRRLYPSKVLQLGPRRQGMRVEDALQLAPEDDVA
jgi:hypothetical protein